MRLPIQKLSARSAPLFGKGRMVLESVNEQPPGIDKRHITHQHKIPHICFIGVLFERDVALA